MVAFCSVAKLMRGPGKRKQPSSKATIIVLYLMTLEPPLVSCSPKSIDAVVAGILHHMVQREESCQVTVTDRCFLYTCSAGILHPPMSFFLSFFLSDTVANHGFFNCKLLHRDTEDDGNFCQIFFVWREKKKWKLNLSG